MSKMLTIDSFFLNEDRHTHNIAVLTNGDGEFKLAPIFDNGAGLLSDTVMEYPLSKDAVRMIDNVRSKTFCDSFEEQLDIAEELYGQQIRFTFNYNDVKGVVDKADIYSEEIRFRVIEIIMQMRRRYEYLIKSSNSDIGRLIIPLFTVMALSSSLTAPGRPSPGPATRL